MNAIRALVKSSNALLLFNVIANSSMICECGWIKLSRKVVVLLVEVVGWEVQDSCSGGET